MADSVASVRVDPGQLQAIDEYMGKLPGAMRRALQDELTVLFQEAEAWMVENRLTGGTTPTRLAVLSGNLVASIRSRVTVRASEIRAELYQDKRYRSAAYLNIQEYGGWVHARPGHYLTIPLNAAARLTRARDTRGLFFFRSRRGNLIAAVRHGRALVVPMFLLVTEVFIPPREPFGGTEREFVEPQLLPRVERVVDRLLAESGIHALGS